MLRPTIVDSLELLLKVVVSEGNTNRHLQKLIVGCLQPLVPDALFEASLHYFSPDV